jgi:hypothetical protein
VDPERASVTLADALGMTAGEVVALVGGGGKTSAMFRLAREMVERGGSAITTTSTRIFGAQIALSPAHVPAAGATKESIADALAVHRQVLVIGPTDAGSGKADPASLIAVAENRQAVDFAESPHEPLRQFHFMAMNRIESALFDELESGDQPGDAQHVGSAAFKKIRHLPRLRLAGRIAAGAAFAPGAQASAGADVERPSSRRA